LEVAAEAPKQELQRPDDSASLVMMFERLAKDPAVDVEKLERLIAMQERIMAHNAKSAFNAAYSVMQPKIPQIDEKGRITNKDRSVRSTYAKLEDIHTVIKPILAQYGFSIRHRTEWPTDKLGTIRIVGILSHEQGHSEESAFEAPADKSDYRTDIQSQGSTVSYGRRYTTLDLLNISTRGADNDGSTSGRPEPPSGYDDWFLNLEAVADNGFKELDTAWAKSSAEFKNFTIRYDKQKWQQIRDKATAVKRG
jgi:hypothetical protein